MLEEAGRDQRVEGDAHRAEATRVRFEDVGSAAEAVDADDRGGERRPGRLRDGPETFELAADERLIDELTDGDE